MAVEEHMYQALMFKSKMVVVIHMASLFARYSKTGEILNTWEQQKAK